MIIFLEDSQNHLRLNLLATRDQALASFKVMHKQWENQFGAEFSPYKLTTLANYYLKSSLHI
jgi:hypothetical protein